MIAAQNNDGSFTDYEIAGNTLTLLVVGEDTTAHTLSWATWFLAREPDVREKLAAAAEERLGADRSPQQYETAAGFEYAEAVLREVLRLKPAVPIIGLEPIEDTVIDGVEVPAGVRLLLLPRMAALRDTSFSDPERFDPSRWTADGSAPGRVHDTSAFLTFGAGQRGCLGYNLAFLEGKSALAMIARNFEVELDESGGPVTERNHFTMGPQGLRIRLHERS
jgi:cytochrome P450